MNSKNETVSKFLSALKVDLIKDVKYVGKEIKNSKCVCGQPIQYCYYFKNIKNNLECTVGKNCLNYVANYLGWNENKKRKDK